MSKLQARPVQLVPREQLQRWQRWQVGHLAPLPSPNEATDVAPAVDTEALARQAEAQRAEALAAELEQRRRQAQEEGYAAGHAAGHEAGHAIGFDEGRQRGYDEGYAAGLAQGQQEALQQAQALAALLSLAQHAVDDLEQQAPPAIARLALTIAEQVLGQAVQQQPEAIVAWVERLLQHESTDSGKVQLHLHPDDAALVGAQLGPTLVEHRWRLMPDASLTRGGCRLTSPLGELDATLATRWQRACAATGLEPPWTLV